MGNSASNTRGRAINKASLSGVLSICLNKKTIKNYNFKRYIIYIVRIICNNDYIKRLLVRNLKCINTFRHSISYVFIILIYLFNISYRYIKPLCVLIFSTFFLYLVDLSNIDKVLIESSRLMNEQFAVLSNIFIISCDVLSLEIFFSVDKVTFCNRDL